MSQPSNRWIVKVVLVIAVVAFVGIPFAGIFMPLIAGINNTQPPNQSTTSNQSSSPSSDPKTKLQDEVRGYELVLQREPENQTALKGLLQARLQLLSQKEGNIQGVIEPLEKLAKLNPEQTEYAVLLAQAKQQIGDKEGAAQAYRTVLATKPGDLKALQGMVALLLDQQHPEAAIGLLQDTLAAAQTNKISPGSVDTIAVQVLLGTVHASQKRYPQALAAYEQAIKKDNKDFRPVLAKAMLLKQQGKAAEAKPLFDSALALAPAQYKDEINKAAAPSSPTPVASPAPTAETKPKP